MAYESRPTTGIVADREPPTPADARLLWLAASRTLGDHLDDCPSRNCGVLRRMRCFEAAAWDAYAATLREGRA